MTLDIKDFYLNTPLKCYEYLCLKFADLPADIITEYDLDKKATHDGYIYVAICKGMYRLPQAGFLVQELLEQQLLNIGTITSLSTHQYYGRT